MTAVMGATLSLAVGVGCSAGRSGEDSSESPGGAAQDLAVPTTVVGTAADSSGGGEGEAALTGTPAVDVAAGRKQVFTASVDLHVEELDRAVADAAIAVSALGGFAASEDVDLSGSKRATIVYRVPAAQFRDALGRLSDIGELLQQTIDSSDVTAQYADLEGRVTTLRTSIARLQGFLSDTTDVNQIASLEGELTRREAELESIEGQRRALADQVELSTISVTYDATTATPAISEPSDRPGFGGGLDAGWDVAVNVAAGVAATVGFLLPFVPVLALVAVGLWWLRRRSRRGAATPPDPRPIAG